eukprot:g26546.t1
MASQIVNFGGNVVFTAAQRVAPTSEDELLAVLNEQREGSVRVVASRHAWSDGIATAGTSIDMRHFDTVRVFEKGGRMWVTVGGGCQIKALLKALNTHGLTTPSVGLITEQTIAGAISTATHGSGKHSLSHYVSAMRVGCYNAETGAAEIRTIDDGDELRAARCALGCLGVIVDVTLPCVEQYFVTERVTRCATIEASRVLESDTPLQQFFLIPHSWSWYVQQRRESPPVRRGFSARAYRVYWFLFIDLALHLMVKLFASLLKSRRLVRFFFRKLLPLSLFPRWVVTDRSDRMLVMKHDLFRHLEMELFVADDQIADASEYLTLVLKQADGAEAALPETIRQRLSQAGLLDAFEALRGRFSHHYPICFRRVLADDALIAMSSGEHDCWYAISLITYVRPRDRFFELATFLARSMRLLFAARIHWGKWFPLDSEAVNDMYPQMPLFREGARRPFDSTVAEHNPARSRKRQCTSFNITENSVRHLIHRFGFCCVAIVLIASQCVAADGKPVRVAAIVTVYKHNSHADVIVGRVIDGFTLDGKGERPNLKLVSLYADQTPKGDLSEPQAKKHKFLRAKSVEQALTLGTGKLAVDGVLLVAEHGSYENSKTGQKLYPKKRLFGEIVKVFKKSGRVVPVFSDKHLSDNWKDASAIYQTSRKMGFPMMAGSSLPSYRREPPVEVRRDAELKEIVAVAYGGIESYGFHALEMIQCLAERRKGGETGVASVQYLTGDAVWEAGKKGVYDTKLMHSALKLCRRKRGGDKPVAQLVKSPTAFIIRYRDGLKASVLMLNGAAVGFSVAWAEKNDGGTKATLFALQEPRPYMHFTYLVKGVEQMMHTGKPTWPVERTLLTTGILHEVMKSKVNEGKKIKTPHLGIVYRSQWNWWHLWFTGYDGTRAGQKFLGYATSTDGLNWRRHPGNPVYREHWVEDMMVVKQGKTFYMFAEGKNDQAQLLKSQDGIRWQRVGPLDIRLTSGKPISAGPRGTPTAYYENGTWYLFYERYDKGVWLATSNDMTVWKNVSDEPVLKTGPGESDRLMIALNQIVRYKGRYYAYYHGSGTPTKPRFWTTNIAVSDDLRHWKKYDGNPLLPTKSNKSSGIVVHDGKRFRLYTMHDEAADWPQWRGPNRDAVSHETGLLKQWPKEGPKVAWKVTNAGVGYSSVVVKDGRVITQGDIDGIEHVIAFSEKDGQLLWASQPEPVAKALDDQVSQQFSRFDKNSDGKLDALEAIAAIGSNADRIDTPIEGADVNKIAETRATQLFAAFDKNADGFLTTDEFPRALQRDFGRIDTADRNADNKALARSRTEAWLKAADKDGDKKVSQQEARNTELQSLFRRIDQRKPGERRGDGFLTVDEMQQYLIRREPGRDGRISKAELTKHYAQRYPGRDGVLSKSDLRRFYGGYRNGQGDGPRGTPTIDGDRVYAEGGNGDVTCFEAATGKTLWHVNLARDFGGGRPGWGYCESPLIIGDLVIVTPGGRKGTIVALNKNNGSPVWQSAEVTQPAHYSSAVYAEISGVKQIVQFARNSVFGVTPDGGKLLWSYKGANNGTANVSTPIVADNHVLVSSGYGTGSGQVHVIGANPQNAKEVYFQKRLANHHGGLVKVGDYVYGFGNGLMCIEFKTGKIQWQARSVRKGSLICVDGMLYCLGERHEVALVEANPKQYVEKGRFRIKNLGRSSWAHPVVANGRMYIRNQGELTAYDIKAR